MGLSIVAWRILAGMLACSSPQTGIENRLKNREGFGVQQTLGLGHLASRVARRKWLPSIRSSDKAVNTSLFACLWSLECVPSHGADRLSWLGLARKPTAHQADPAACLPSAEVPSVLHHWLLPGGRACTRVFTATPARDCSCWCW